MEQLELFETKQKFELTEDGITEVPHVASEEEVQTLTDQLLAQQSNIKPEKAAEMVFQGYFPKYAQLVSTLSNKDARRIATAVVGYPLESSNIDFHSEEAKEAFSIAIILQDAKFILTQKVLADKLNELEKAEAQAKANETNSPVTPDSLNKEGNK